LADAISAALPLWVERVVERVMVATGRSYDAEIAAAACAAGQRAVAELAPQIRVLLDADIDEQRTTPLSLLRTAVRYPTAVLRAAGVPPVERDDFARDAFPDDDYDLTPASFADVDDSLVEPGLLWGAAKAFEHKRRHGGAQRD
jgi:hypothetical protein